MGKGLSNRCTNAIWVANDTTLRIVEITSRVLRLDHISSSVMSQKCEPQLVRLADTENRMRWRFVPSANSLFEDSMILHGQLASS